MLSTTTVDHMMNNHTNFRLRYVLSASVRRISRRVSAVQRNWTTVTEGSWALIVGDSRTNGRTIDFRPKNIERNIYVHTGCSKSFVRVSLQGKRQNHAESSETVFETA